MIERPLQSQHANPDEGSFEQVDRILDVVESAMNSVASRHRLRETKIQRWRWDQPEILMSWTPILERPCAGKNIRALVSQDGSNSLSCAFESNAWFDDREPSGPFTRHWDYFPADVIRQISPESTQWHDKDFFLAAIEKAYGKDSDAKRIRLDHAIHISPNGDAREVNKSAIFGPDSVKTMDTDGP